LSTTPAHNTDRDCDQLSFTQAFAVAYLMAVPLSVRSLTQSNYFLRKLCCHVAIVLGKTIPDQKAID
jgi:hypothetical protein